MTLPHGNGIDAPNQTHTITIEFCAEPYMCRVSLDGQPFRFDGLTLEADAEAQTMSLLLRNSGAFMRRKLAIWEPADTPLRFGA
jgi:hypothetical protein